MIDRTVYTGLRDALRPKTEKFMGPIGRDDLGFFHTVGSKRRKTDAELAALNKAFPPRVPPRVANLEAYNLRRGTRAVVLEEENKEPVEDMDDGDDAELDGLAVGFTINGSQPALIHGQSADWKVWNSPVVLGSVAATKEAYEKVKD